MVLIEDDSAVGRVLMVHVNGKFYEWKAPKGNLQQIRGNSLSGAHLLRPCPFSFHTCTCAANARLDTPAQIQSTAL